MSNLILISEVLSRAVISFIYLFVALDYFTMIGDKYCSFEYKENIFYYACEITELNTLIEYYHSVLLRSSLVLHICYTRNISSNRKI